ncbi:MAG: N-6 DNA methylase [Euryarchaeota archaeon]|nr:N-6 DNA methylase [Euryarchaeota archaeon]
MYTERAKTAEQDAKFNGNNPDYVLYRSGTDEPIAIVETKRPGRKPDDFLTETVEKYARPLGVSIVFIHDSAFVKTWDTRAQRELSIDGITVSQLVTEQQLLRFLSEGPAISEVTPKVRHTRQELIAVYDWANDLLRKEGLREGLERFTEFANLLFLKLISEKEREREALGESRVLAEQYCWESFASLAGPQMMAYVNGTVLPHLVREYNHSGDVFQAALHIKNPQTLVRIVSKLSSLNLLDAETDVKGDAFEYFLRDSVTIGNDLGEYFTPRHIVNLMVNLVEPKLTEKVYDPACGTAGFLIQTFDYIQKRNARRPEVLRILREATVYGREVTSTAAIAKMNMILTGDGHANIREIDSLREPQKEAYDVVLSNIPYGQTTDWGNLYPVPSNNGDSVFTQHAWLSLKTGPDSRAALVVPEGLLFSQSLENVRKFLLTHADLVAVISLPRGVFRPYAKNNKTDILLFTKNPRGTRSTWFYEMEADGFDLESDSRRPVDHNDIPDLYSKWLTKSESPKSWSVPIERIARNHYRLVAKEYAPFVQRVASPYPQLSFAQIAREDKARITIDDSRVYSLVTARLHGGGIVSREQLQGRRIKVKDQKPARAGQLLVAAIDAKMGGYGVVPSELDGAIVSSHYYLFNLDTARVRPEYVDYVLRYGPYEPIFKALAHGTTNYADIRPADVLGVEIPVPELEIQDRVATQVREKVEVARAASSALASIEATGIDESVFVGAPTAKLSSVAQLNLPYALTPDSSRFYVEMADVDEIEGKVHYSERSGPLSGLSRFREGDVLFARMTPCTENGKIAIARGLGSETGLGSTELVVISPNPTALDPEWLYFYLSSRTVRDSATRAMLGTTGRERVPNSFFDALEVPVPPLSEQKRIATELRSFIRARVGLIETQRIADKSARTIIGALCKPEVVRAGADGGTSTLESFSANGEAQSG